jgi:hypothetical protein
MSGPTLTVVPFTGGNVNDIPAGLRSLAELIENGPAGGVAAVSDAVSVTWIAVNAAGAIESGCIGSESDRFKLAGIMQAAAMKLLGGSPC